ncbi:MAG: CDGSH iron-sulfur domain-containing protein [Bacteroidia bacterium]|nr:CDGSH iron-sulfur domain-containing protein [Bacteroidia bacterium]
MDPSVPQKSPYGLDLGAGTYYWCACGRSTKQPFCDGSHRGTGFMPHKLVLETPKRVWLCGCKHTKTPPYCDGTHRSLP